MATSAAAASTVDPALPTDADLDESWARVFIRANPGPFQYLAYEVTARGPAGVASHVRGMMGRRDAVTRTELLPREELRRLFGKLRDLGALDLRPPPLPAAPLPKSKAKAAADDDPLAGPPSSSTPIYLFSFRLAGRENTFLVADPLALSDRRYAAFLQAVRDTVTATAGAIGYVPPSGPPGEEGWLFIDSVPGSRVTVDGTELPEETPVFAYACAPGAHTVLLENQTLGLSKSYKVQVQAGMTTSLEVDLR